MTDEEQIGAVVDGMYAMISGPAGPRDWSRQRNSFLAEARQVRTWVDDHPEGWVIEGNYSAVRSRVWASTSPRIRLTATSRPVRPSQARWTVPMAPFPSSCWSL